MRLFIRWGVGSVIAVLTITLFGWYSMTWGERRLRPIQTGMSKPQVRQLLGDSWLMVKRANGTTAWHYERWWSSEAIVYFDVDQKVSAKETD